jgi:hypothetical protein
MNRRASLAGYADSHPPTGSLFDSQNWLSFRFLLTAQRAKAVRQHDADRAPTRHGPPGGGIGPPGGI